MRYKFGAVHALVLVALVLGTILCVRSATRGYREASESGPGVVEKRQSSGASGKEHARMGEVAEVTQATFEESVLKSDLPVLVDFWAPWCGPCRMLSPTVEELAKDYAGKLKVVKLNTDDYPSAAGDYGIKGIPTLIFFKDGKEVDRIVGAQPKSALSLKIDSVVSDGK